MGYVLLWIENLVTVLLLVATLLACAGRVRGRRARLVLVLLAILLPVLVYGALAAGLLVAHVGTRLQVDGLYSFLALTLAITCGSVWLRFRGLKSRVDIACEAATWPRGKLALAFFVAAMLHLMTFWNLDTAIGQRLARVRAEAGALALSVAPARVADHENAMVIYQQAFEILSGEETDSGVLGDAIAALKDPDNDFDFRNQELARRLEEFAPVLGALGRAAAMPGYCADREYARPSFDMLMPDIPHWRTATHLLLVNARHKSAAGDAGAALGDVGTVLAMAGHVGSEPILIALLVGGAMEDDAWDTLETVLGTARCSMEDLSELGDHQRRNRRGLLERALRTEEAFGLAVFCRAGDLDVLEVLDVVKAIGGFGGAADSHGIMGRFLGQLYRVFLLPGDLRMYRELMLRIRSIVAEPGYDLERRCEQLESWWWGRRRGLLSSCVAGPLTNVIRRVLRSDCRRRVTRLGIAMHGYRVRHGSFPPNLDELRPEFIDRIPTDPYSGTPLRLKRSETGWVVYSVGPSKSETHADSYLAGLRSKDDDVAGLMFGYRGTP